MKVLHVIPAVAERYGGPSNAVVGLCRELAARNIEVLVATTDADGEGVLPVENGRVVLHGSVPAIFFHRQWSEAFKYSRPLKRWIDNSVSLFDLIHVHAVYSHACLAAAAAARRAAIPYIVRPLGTLSPWSLQQKALRKCLGWHLGVRQMLKGAAAIHCTSDSEARDLEPLGLANKAIVVPLGVEIPGGDEDRSEYPWMTEPYILALGRIHEKKGLDVLIRAFAAAAGVFPQLKAWRLVVAGQGDPVYCGYLRRLSEKTGYSDRMIFPGWVSGQIRRQMLRKAAVLAMPSHQENFGLSAVEGMACSVPVLVSNSVDLSSVIEQAGAGWTCDLNAESLAASLVDIAGREEERKRRGARGRILVEQHYTWPVVTEKLLETYRRVAISRC